MVKAQRVVAKEVEKSWRHIRQLQPLLDGERRHAETLGNLVDAPSLIGQDLKRLELVGRMHRLADHVFRKACLAGRLRIDHTAGEAAIQGSSYLRLPRLLQWFSGNIGFHHVHHLNPRIPNYRLQACHDGSGPFGAVPTLSLWRALKQWRYVLWDEDAERMVRFPAMGSHRDHRPTAPAA